MSSLPRVAKLKVRPRDGEAAPRWCCGADGGSRDVCEARARDGAAVPPVVVVPTAGRAVRARSRIHERTSVLHPCRALRSSSTLATPAVLHSSPTPRLRSSSARAPRRRAAGARDEARAARPRHPQPRQDARPLRRPMSSTARRPALAARVASQPMRTHRERRELNRRPLLACSSGGAAAAVATPWRRDDGSLIAMHDDDRRLSVSREILDAATNANTTPPRAWVLYWAWYWRYLATSVAKSKSTSGVYFFSPRRIKKQILRRARSKKQT